MQIIHWCVFYFDYAYYKAVWHHKVYNMAASITVYTLLFKRPQFSHFITDFDKTGIRTYGL